MDVLVALVFRPAWAQRLEDLQRSGVSLTGRVYPQVKDAVDAYNRGELSTPSTSTKTTKEKRR